MESSYNPEGCELGSCVALLAPKRVVSSATLEAGGEPVTAALVVDGPVVIVWSLSSLPQAVRADATMIAPREAGMCFIVALSSVVLRRPEGCKTLRAPGASSVP